MITVLGSINLDLVVSVPRLPGAGETVIGPDHQAFPGGKGGNQALAACRAGADVAMVGAVGMDAFGAMALDNLEKAGVDLDRVRKSDRVTGLAMIGVDQNGENQILVASGANAEVRAAWIAGQLGPGDILLLQGEIPPGEIGAAMTEARPRGARTIFNPAPVPVDHIDQLIKTTDVLIVNRTEAGEIAHRLGISAQPDDFAEHLASDSRIVVVTLGGDGILARQADQVFRMMPPEMAVLDTTGAGDAFCGALAAGFDRGLPVEMALRQAVAAGSLACQATGAQSSAPELSAITDFEKEIRLA